MAVTQIDVRAVRLIAAPSVPVDDNIRVAVLVHISKDKRLCRVLWQSKRCRPAGEGSAAIAMIDVDSPALKGRDQVHVAVIIQVPDGQCAAGHCLFGSDLRKGSVELPVSLSITVINLDARLLKSDQDKFQRAVPIDISELGCHVPVVCPKSLFCKSPFSVTEEGLHNSKVARQYDVRESIAVDIPNGKRAIADIAPSRLDRGELAFAVAKPHVKARFEKPRGSHEIEMSVSIDIDEKGVKAPFLAWFQREGLGVCRKGWPRSGEAGVSRREPAGR